MHGIRILFAIILGLAGSQRLCSQGEFGIVAGISNYQGDLASYSTEAGFRALIGPVLGLHLGIEKSKAFQLRSDLLYLRLSGDDALADKEDTRARNLDFRSPVFQLAAGADWNLFGFSQEESTDFSPYLSLGASLFYMDPRTTYQDKTVRLHPLGTEGQYLDTFNQKPYSLFQPSLQFGGGLKFLTRGKIVIALEAMMSYTFTDYIDDVSTIYITYPDLLAQAGELTAALANRQGELLGTDPVVVDTGLLRGNPKTKDFFGVITLRVSKPFAISTRHFKLRGQKGKRIHCPKF